jgi:hypothetical protein
LQPRRQRIKRVFGAARDIGQRAARFGGGVALGVALEQLHAQAVL